MEPLFNGLVLAADGLALWWLARRPDRPPAWSALLRALLVPQAAGAVVALLVWEGHFHLIRMACFLLFGHLPLGLLASAALLWRRQPGLARLAAATALALAGVAVFAFRIEPFRLEVSHHRLEFARLSRPLRVVVVSDIQTDAVGPWEERVIRATLAEKPDLLLLCGDYVQEEDPARRRVQQAALNQLLRRLGFAAPLGAYAVEGNSDSPDWPEVFSGLPVVPVSRTRRFDLGDIQITGLSMIDSYKEGLEIAAAPGFHIVFGHYPDYALGRIPADLLVAGHCHGGQVQLPLFGPPIIFSPIPRAWAEGVTDLPGDRRLVVSRGLGMERKDAPRLRFLCRPEIVVLDLVPAAGGAGR